METSPEKNFSTQNPEGSAEKMVSIETAKGLYADLLEYHNQPLVDRDTYDAIETKSAQLSEILATLSWHERVANGLPWHPHDEVANTNRAPVSEAA